jgi:2-dehydropantoate 2-reductase
MALNGVQVTVAARGKSLAAIQQNGLQLTDMYGQHRVRVPAAEGLHIPRQDVVFPTSKAQDLVSLSSSVQNLIRYDTWIVPIVNGIPWWYFEGEKGHFSGRNVRSGDAAGQLKLLLPSSQVIGSVAMFTADRPEPGVARSLNPIRLILGEIDNEVRPRTVDLANLLNQCGIETRVSERVRDPLWTKVIANLISNPLSAVAGATLRDLAGDPCLARITRELLDEALLTAASYGARLEMEPEQLLEFAKNLGNAKTSMLQDYEKGQPLELCAIADAVLELAHLRRLTMPLTRCIAAIARYKGRTSTGRMDA